MVRAGPYSLRVVDADTNAALAEHVDGFGQAWVAGEEGREFWVEIEHIAESAPMAVCKVYVDGAYIGFNKHMSAGVRAPHKTPYLLGPYKAGQQIDAGDAVVHIGVSDFLYWEPPEDP